MKNGCCNQGCGGCAERITQWDFAAPNGQYFNMMKLSDRGMLVPQHSHTEPHTTLLVAGSLRAWRGDELLGDFTAPAAIYVEAKAKHTFVSLEPNTLAYCVFSQLPVTDMFHDPQEALTCLSQQFSRP
jgi:hypothetical protein